MMRSFTFTVAPSTRASARIGSASSSAKPLASVTKRPERSVFGKGLAPQEGVPPEHQITPGS